MIVLALLILSPYIFIIIKVFIGLSKTKIYQPAKTTDIFVSVVIPCKNEDKSLPHLLDCLSRQDYDPLKFEVIVVNDNSDDNTASVGLSYSNIRNLKIISNSGKGKKRAIREGVANANGELIITCDADCRLPERWLKTIASYYEEKLPGLIIAPVKISDSKFAPWFQKLEFLSLQGITAGTALNGNPIMCNGANLAFSKDCYNRYSSRLSDNLVSGDDIFLLQNIKKEGLYKVSWLESIEAMASTEGSTSCASFISQRARWISKASAYNDGFTTLTSLSTLLAVMLQASLFFMMLIDTVYLKAFITAFIIKSIPDFLILNNTTKRYDENGIMKWFVPCQLAYPVYVLTVILKSLLGDNKFTTR